MRMPVKRIRKMGIPVKPAVAMFSTAVILLGLTSLAVAQDSRGQGTSDADQLRLRIRDCADVDAAQRDRMRENLEDCLREGADPQNLEPIFPREDGTARMDPATMLRLQERVRTMLHEGLSADLVLDKIREGGVKGVAAPMLERAVGQMEAGVRRAHQYLGRIEDSPASQPDSPQHRGMLERHLALNLWSGLEEGDLDRLHDRARRRDGSCTPSDLVSAADVLTVARQRGMDLEQALRLVGDAMEAGYTHRDMRTLGAMMAAAEMDEYGNRVREHLHEGMGQHRDFGEMAREMMSWGWMGPADMDHGGGWRGMMDDWLGGGPGDHDGRMGDHDHDGMGGGGMGDGTGGDHGGMGGN